MERVTGIGGFFWKAHDPEALRHWYEDNLGITMVGEGYDDPVWEQEQGQTVLSPFSEESDFFGRSEQQWKINFRVDDLDAMAEQLRGAGIDVEIDPQDYPNGRFADLFDPEGNPIQLWEPA